MEEIFRLRIGISFVDFLRMFSGNSQEDLIVFLQRIRIVLLFHRFGRGKLLKVLLDLFSSISLMFEERREEKEILFDRRVVSDLFEELSESSFTNVDQNVHRHFRRSIEANRMTQFAQRAFQQLPRIDQRHSRRSRRDLETCSTTEKSRRILRSSTRITRRGKTKIITTKDRFHRQVGRMFNQRCQTVARQLTTTGQIQRDQRTCQSILNQTSKSAIKEKRDERKDLYFSPRSVSR